MPPSIRRALDHRDGGCRFPGCGLRFCDAHHITHWADGGETRLDNLVLLCRRHHRAVHEEGFRVEFVGNVKAEGEWPADGGCESRWNEGGQASGGITRGSVRFYWPDGRLFPDAPAAPELPSGDPVAALEAEHGSLGIRPGPDTTTPRWNGEPLDLGWAMYVFRNR